MRLGVVVCALLLVAGTARAIDEELAFEDPQLEARYQTIIEEVRCLKCQNNTIKDSSAFLAADLRREIRRMLSDGYSDQEIYDFLVDRYGEFALYRPRASGKTLILWILPVAFLAFGGLALARIVRRRMALPIDED